MKPGTGVLAAIALLVTAFPLAANDDLVLYVNASATFSFPMPSDASMWKELVATVDLDVNEQLAFREAQVAWLSAEHEAQAPEFKDRAARHIPVLKAFVSHLDTKSRVAFQHWVEEPPTVVPSASVKSATVPEDLAIVLGEFRNTLFE